VSSRFKSCILHGSQSVTTWVRRDLPGPVMLLCLSSRPWRSLFEESVEAAGEVAFEAAVCFASRLAFLESAFDVGDRGGV
jgi:hypothetical protein